MTITRRLWLTFALLVILLVTLSCDFLGDWVGGLGREYPTALPSMQSSKYYTGTATLTSSEPAQNSIPALT
jgi:hypothetical protein